MASLRITILLIFWVAAIAAGVALLIDYDYTPAKTGAIASHWPTTSSLTRDLQGPTLVLFVHPRCPCSKASLHELSTLTDTYPRTLKTIAVFSRPAVFQPGWEKSDLWKSAERAGGIQLVADDGTEAKRFGATTSGEAFLFDRDGRLQFHGGITPSRGHPGPNLGEQSIVALLETGATDCHQAAVFGCALFSATTLNKVTSGK